MQEYDKILQEIRNMLTTASKQIPRLYEALIKEGLDPFSARDRIEKDLIDVISKRTILRNLPEESKRKYEKSLIAVTNEGHHHHDIGGGVVTPTTGYRPLSVTQQSKPTTQKTRLTYDLEIRGQIIPLSIVVHLNRDTLEVDIDRVEIRD